MKSLAGFEISIGIPNCTMCICISFNVCVNIFCLCLYIFSPLIIVLPLFSVYCFDFANSPLFRYVLF